MPGKLALAAAGAVAAAIPLLTATPAFSHGYTTSPPSRSYRCAQQQVADCGSIQYEPQSVEGPKGFPQAGPPTATSAARTTLSSPSSTTRVAARGPPPR